MRIHPFAAIRAPAHRVSEVSCPPYDVVNRDEALEIARAKPNSFMRVIRSEVDFPPEQDPYAPEVYAAAAANFDSLLERGYLVRDPEPRMYVYRQSKGGRRQAGLVCCVDVDSYRTGDLVRHELTRADKEQDRVNHIRRLEAHTESVFLAIPPEANFTRQLARDMNDRPLLHFAAKDGVTNTLWSVDDSSAYTSIFRDIPLVYVADGHHRSAAADRAAHELDAEQDQQSQRFPAVIYGADELAILPYHRLARLPAGVSAEAFIDLMRNVGEVRAIDVGPPLPQSERGVVGIFAAGRWWSLSLPTARCTGPLAELDVQRLSESVLEPLLGIRDIRTDSRISFLGGCAAERLAEEVDAGRADVAFAVHPTSMDDLFRVAKAGLIMPPKSTWFDPKIRSGIFAHVFGSRAAG